MEKVRPTCRYHQIPLERDGDLWGIDGFMKMTVELGGPPLKSIAPNGRHFVLSLYRCPECGYAEFFDDDDAAMN